MTNRLCSEDALTFMKTIFSCDELRIGSAIIPPFLVSANEFVGLAPPNYYQDHRKVLMQSIGGLIPNAGIRIGGKSAVILPLGYRPPGHTTKRDKLVDLALKAGLSQVCAKRISAGLQVDPHEVYVDLQITPRLLFDLQVAFAQEAELVVFSTCGLDPCGIMAVNAAVSGMLDRCSAIDVFSVSLIESYESLMSFSKVIRCRDLSA